MPVSPVNRAPTLVCRSCGPVTHTYVGREPELTVPVYRDEPPSVARAWGLNFACRTCGEVRRYGLEVGP